MAKFCDAPKCETGGSEVTSFVVSYLDPVTGGSVNVMEKDLCAAHREKAAKALKDAVGAE